ncbi:MAG: substrate-binding domain-containing protein, partial [Burkholderiales bacterium]|nr:substrate-binding domain-containing protein [Burkholderiales bacterium]
QPGLRLVNRQRGSGTRVLLDSLLRAESIDTARIEGYDSGEFTHAAVAAFVSSGMVDAAFGVEPAARQFKLDFLPIAKERYMLLCRNESLQQAPVQELITLLKGAEFRRMTEPVPGYSLDDPGNFIDFRDVFPEGRPSP